MASRFFIPSRKVPSLARMIPNDGEREKVRKKEREREREMALCTPLAKYSVRSDGKT
jgi:hypothetical protein